MPSERVQRRIDAMLDQIEVAVDEGNWERVRERAHDVLALDPENTDASDFLVAAERRLIKEASDLSPVSDTTSGTPSSPATQVSEVEPTSFADGRYVVKRFLGEGGKKKVYLAHDELLDRDIAFALIKSEGLDDVSRERITREAQAMGRLGSHPHIVTVLDLGEAPSTVPGQPGQPYMVIELLAGGDVEGIVEDAPGHKLPRCYTANGYLK